MLPSSNIKWVETLSELKTFIWRFCLPYVFSSSSLFLLYPLPPILCCLPIALLHPTATAAGLCFLPSQLLLPAPPWTPPIVTVAWLSSPPHTDILLAHPHSCITASAALPSHSLPPPTVSVACPCSSSSHCLRCLDLPYCSHCSWYSVFTHLLLTAQHSRLLLPNPLVLLEVQSLILTWSSSWELTW